ncbi:unnamed protein product [Allacma fusca]|uniref:Major facilitator superfamily (MFS) profile domain-containing protein n=1 Tax=Allacma fusca TaxID=39272 RepID=A0A8J2JP32_9HEXA|nr:unnamed protein product [Allacma fusca]
MLSQSQEESGEESYLLKSQSNKKDSLDDFDGMLEAVGSEGRFQKILLYVLICPIAVSEPFFSMSMFFLLYIPNHWCHVPGRGNVTEELWKQMTIPMEPSPDGGFRYSHCSMYDANNTVVSCQYGWDYDRTYYQSTIATEFDWVCEKEDYATRAFTFSNIGNAVGGIILGHLADKIGRKPVVFICLMNTLVFGGIGLFVPRYFGLFLTTQFLSGLAYPSLITALCLIGSENCSKEYRSWVFSLTCFFRVIGNVIFPIIAWTFGTWFEIGIISLIPAIAMLCFVWGFLPESPRWLLSVGKVERAHKVLTKIARTNGRATFELKTELNRVHETFQANQKKVFGAWTLFSKRRLAKHTVLLCTTWAFIGLIFYGLNLTTLNMSGNPFINHMLLIGLIDLPAGWVLGFVAEKTGRRWTQVVLLTLSGMACISTTFLISQSEMSLGVLTSIIIAKFFIVIADLITDLQGSELFPTPLRSTGFSLASTTSSFMGIIGPYLIFMGKSYAAGPYVVLSCLSLLAAVLSSFFPETHRTNLPETVEEANDLGKNDRYWKTQLLNSDLATLLGVGAGMTLFCGLTCLVLRIFARARFGPRHHHYANAHLAPPITLSTEHDAERGGPSRHSSQRSSQGGSRRPSTLAPPARPEGSRRPSNSSIRSTASARSYSLKQHSNHHHFHHHRPSDPETHLGFNLNSNQLSITQPKSDTNISRSGQSIHHQHSPNKAKRSGSAGAI